MRQFRIICSLVLLAALPFGCSKEYTPTQEITDVRPANGEETAARDMSTMDRMRLQPIQVGDVKPGMGAAPMAGGDMSADSSAPEFTWQVPSGWEELAPTSMRLANLQVSGHPEAECYFTVLPGDGGGLTENINRWRRQIGLEPITDDQVGAIPEKPLLLKSAKFLMYEGAYTGMGTEAAPDYMMYGLILIDQGRAYFVKMTGPKAVLADQLAQFNEFCQSIMESGGLSATAAAASPATPAVEPTTPPVPEAGMEPSGSGASIDASNVQYEVPAGWENAGDRPMRSVTFNISPNTECYVAVLGGTGGGLESNLNRWRGQMGQPALDSAAIAALETVDIAGVPSPIIEITGEYTGMSGGASAGYMMLGTARVTDAQALFVKMVGPEAEVAAQRDNFRAFCASIH
ncbi:MAG: hypothetical protein GC168_06090 [Candidatus Hydrogenedens sp.]|nr:hypothetical protein [Candidatus Hydrogenedens sp.]